MKRNLANFAIFQVAWFACVLGAADGSLWIGPAAVLVAAIANLAWGGSRGELALYVGVGVLGGSLDTLLHAVGAIGFPSADPWLPHPAVPLWIVSLWVAFATLLRRSLSWLAGRYMLAAVLGAVGGPLSFRAGATLGAVELGENTALAYGLLALEWAVVTPLLLWVAHRAPRRAPEDPESPELAPSAAGTRHATPALLVLIALPAFPDASTPRPSTWRELCESGFEQRWLLPESDSLDDLTRIAADLVARELAPLEAVDPNDALARARSLGDLVALYLPLRGDDPGREALLARIERERPDLWQAFGFLLPELLRETEILGDYWSPTEDAADDGLYVHAELDLRSFGRRPWSKIKTGMQQAATLVFADIDAIKEIENDFARYPLRIGSTVDSIRVVSDSYVRGEGSETGGPFTAVRVVFESDLPWPFSGYECDMYVLNRLDESGRLVCDIYSTSDDFHWFGGRDVCYPLVTSNGEWVATLLVRQFGFDLDGVPDGDGNRREGLRMSLGNVKRDAENRFDGNEVDPGQEVGRIPDFEVIG